MKIQNKHFETIWLKKGNQNVIQTLDQRFLPFEVQVFEIDNVEKTYYAIKEMVVRGAPLIGVTAAYGMYLSVLNFNQENLRSEERL